MSSTIIVILAWAGAVLWPVLLGLALWRGLKRGRGPGWFGWSAVLVVSVAWFLGIWAFLWEPSQLVIRRVEATSAAWSGAALKIGVISDTHTDGAHMGVGRLNAVIDAMNAEQPDIVVLLGDFVGGHASLAERGEGDRKEIADGLAAFSRLRAPLGVHAVLGNHDWWYDGPTVEAQLKLAGVNVMESVCWDFGGNPDWFNVTLDAARGGTFPSFPHTGNETIRALKLEFRDDTSPAELFNVHVLPDSLTQVCAMTSATGAVQAGSSTLAFTLNPSSVSVTLPAVPVSMNKTATGIELFWESEAGKSYRIEGTSDLRCWSDEGFHFGTGSMIQQNLTPFATYPKRFYRIVEL